VDLDWTATDYAHHLGVKADGFQSKSEQVVDSQYSPIYGPNFPIITKPCTIVDAKGYILFWFLLGLLHPDIQTAGWRGSPALFKPKDRCPHIEPGLLNFAPAWFQLGRQVCGVITMQSKAMLTGTQPWLKSMLEGNAVMNAVLSVIHPDLYLVGSVAHGLLRESDSHSAVMEHWNSVYSGVTVIANRETPVHRDPNCRLGWFDLLATVGPYQYAELELRG
ncbi:hypothetical protein JAAARDRAFT_109867, partial [Jaapia argillacea MUCL 33604]